MSRRTTQPMTTLPTTKRTTTRSTTTTTTRSWLSSLRLVTFGVRTSLGIGQDHNLLKVHFSSTQWFNQPTDQNPIGWSSWGQWSECRLNDPRKCSGTRIRSRKCSGRCSTGGSRDHGHCQAIGIKIKKN